MWAARVFERCVNPELAREAYTSFADLIVRSNKEEYVQTVERMQGAVRRLGLVGQDIDLGGTKLDGSDFEWHSYRGRVVLVGFVATARDSNSAERLKRKTNYKLYHDRGFEIVEVLTNRDCKTLDGSEKGVPVPWVILHDSAEGRHSVATHYGVPDEPTAFLVGKDGKVISTEARGDKLDQLLAECIGPPYQVAAECVCVDLRSKTNLRLAEGLPVDPDDNLQELPTGEQTMQGVKFMITDGLIQLGSQGLLTRPKIVEGIPIGWKFKRLYILQGTLLGDAEWVQDGTAIGEYRLHFEDRSTMSIPIVFGEDVRDWREDGRFASRGRVAWRGGNTASRKQNTSVRLYLSTWDNPNPEKRVVGIDFLSRDTTRPAPFCVAMTLE
jgi:hypothetical protein